MMKKKEIKKTELRKGKRQIENKENKPRIDKHTNKKIKNVKWLKRK